MKKILFAFFSIVILVLAAYSIKIINLSRMPPSLSSDQLSPEEIETEVDAVLDDSNKVEDSRSDQPFQKKKAKAAGTLVNPVTASKDDSRVGENPQPNFQPDISYSEQVETIVRDFETDRDQEKAMEALIAIKEDLTGESLQSAMKLMHQLGEAGGNDILAETYLDHYASIPEHDRMRILSYLNPEFSLSDYHLWALSDAYLSETSQEASDAVLMAIAAAGGDYGAGILIDMADAENDYDRYTRIITAIGHSKSSTAIDFLNRELNILVSQDIEYQDKELIRLIRTLIKNNKPN